MSNLSLVGIDEAGRGAIAGPIVVASFIDIEKYPDFIKDSKRIKEDEREKIFDYFIENKFCFGVGIVSNEFIDNNGITKALKEGIYLSLNFLFEKESTLFNSNFLETYDYRKNYSLFYPSIKKLNKEFLILIDGNNLFIKDNKTIAVIDGDDRILVISAASIVAKVVRDRIMRILCKKFNGYNLSINKGYCTKDHLKRLEKFGASLCHRKSFIKNFENVNKVSNTELT